MTTCRWTLLLLLAAASACSKPSTNPLPDTDVVLTTPDSSFWITSDRRGLRMRGVPMLLARVEGRFKELYVTDDDRSYFDAVFVGQHLYMRDLVAGDSIEVFADSLVPRLAREYAAANPREERLAPNEDGSDHPGTTATADLQILGVHGPYLSFEYRTDVDAQGPNGAEHITDRHSARRGVVDLRTGKPVSVATLFGRAEATRAVEAASAQWTAARDSLLARRDDRSRRAQRTVVAFAFDPMSFSIDADEREPQVVFGVPGAVSGGNAGTLELSALPMHAPDWWPPVLGELPTGPDSLRTWTRGPLEVVARVMGSAERALVELRARGKEARPLGSVTSPVERALWLDSSVTSEARRALHRAFNEAAQYSDDNRIAAVPHDAYIFRNANAIAKTPVSQKLRRTSVRHPSERRGNVPRAPFANRRT